MEFDYFNYVDFTSADKSLGNFLENNMFLKSQTCINIKIKRQMNAWLLCTWFSFLLFLFSGLPRFNTFFFYFLKI